MFKSSTLLNQASQIFLICTSFLSLSMVCARADGQPPGTKTSESTEQESDYSSSTSGFLPLPGWAGHIHMPVMPDQLKPFGKQPVVATPTPAPVVTPPPATTAATKPTTPADAEAHKEEGPLTAISPFLDWIKNDPNAAAAMARKEAARYPENNPNSAPPPPDSGAFDPNRPYWLPPIKNSTDNNSPTDSSSATYQRPSQ